MAWQIRNSFSALRHRNFRLFVPGQFVSLIGFWMQALGQSWLVYRLTHSAAYLGAIGFCQQIPVLLLALPGGGVVDRVNRHRLVILTQSLALLQASILTYLTYTGKINLPWLFVMASFIGIVSAFDLPARQAFLVQMVGREDLMNAIALNSSMFNAARVVGPAIAGFALAKWGEAVCFFLNAITYLAVIVPLFMMRIVRSEETARKSWAKDIAEGFQYIRETKPVGVLLRLVGAFGIGGFAFTVLLPIFADSVFRRGAGGLGWLMTGVGSGALIGALFLAGRKGLGGIGRVIAYSSFGFGLFLMLFSMSIYFWISFALLICVGFFMMLTIASINTTIQSIIPDHIRGRVMSFFTTMLIGTAPIGSLISGTIAKYAGARVTIFISSLVCLTAAFWFHRWLPKIRPEARRLYLLQNPTVAGTMP
jgi:MFS family permease